MASFYLFKLVMMIISQIKAPLAAETLEQLTAILHEAVSLGASIGFTDAAQQLKEMYHYWQQIDHGLTAGHIQLYCAFVDNHIVGVVGLEVCQKLNGRHRGEVFKLIVSASWRGQGIARKLMQSVTHEAEKQGLKLLLLDTRSNDITVPFYQSLGWRQVGEIPNYALSTEGELQATTLMALYLSSQ